MGPIASIKTCLRKYATFSGRAPRSEFWWFLLAFVLLEAALAELSAVLFDRPLATANAGGYRSNSSRPGYILLICFLAASTIPLLAAASRRVHDTGRAATWILLAISLRVCCELTVINGALGLLGQPKISDQQVSGLVIPLVSIALNLLIIWWLVRPSQPGTNRYGPNPNEVPT